MIVVKCSDYKGRRKSNYKNVPYDSGESLIDYHMIMVIVMDYDMIMVIVTDHHMVEVILIVTDY